MNISEALNTIALLIPGYFGAWTMGFVLGVRRREWPQTVLYSLLFSALTYLIVLRLSPPIVYGLRDLGLFDFTGFQRALNQVSNIGLEGQRLVFHNTVKVIGVASLLSTVLGYVIGRFRRSEWFTGVVLSLTNRTQNTDIWTDFHQRHRIGPHSVVLKSGDMYHGKILTVSDTLTGADRGIIMHRPMIVQNALQLGWTGTKPGIVEAPGHILLFADQIVSISSNEHPTAILRYERDQRVQRGKSWLNRRLRRVRKDLRRVSQWFA